MYSFRIIYAMTVTLTPGNDRRSTFVLFVRLIRVFDRELCHSFVCYYRFLKTQLINRNRRVLAMMSPMLATIVTTLWLLPFDFN